MQLEENMQLSDLQFSTLAPLFSNTIVLVILALMLVISLRLYVDRRKKGYLSMTISLSFLMIHYLLLSYFHFSPLDNSLAVYISMMLNMVSFVLVNMGIYQLYNPTKKRHYAFFYGLIALGFLISLLHFYVPEWYKGTEHQVQLLQDIGLELYMFALIFLCFYIIPSFIGQHGKYQIALTVYFTNQIAHIVNVYMYDKTETFLTVCENILPIIYYFMLFLLLFERVLELMQAIYNSSITDGLTRLYNRKFFYNRVTQYVQRHLPVSILFSDIDNFKKLNDTKGHQKGDEVLRQVALIMKEESEECGIAGRYGGEEMVVLITDSTVKMDVFAEKVRRRVEEETIVTVSVGYSTYKGGVHAEQLIKQADEAMYKAKTTGKNKVVSYG
jgi:diguanylate cyclase (GGDEF)-like protein